MIDSIIYNLLGYITFTVPAFYKEQTLNCIYKEKIHHRRQFINADGHMSFDVLSIHTEKVRDAIGKLGISFSETKLCGLPKLINRYKKRWGIFLGALVFTIFVSISQNYVWYIDVKGCETLSEESILENLSALGFTYGTNFKKIDFDYLRNSYLATNDDLSWISINMEGTYAHVEVRELKDPPKTETEGSVNVVASEKGRIVLVESFEGAPVVFPGDLVGEGELLISGIMTSGEDELRFERASGKVLAEVERHFKAEIPKFEEKKVYTDAEKKEISLIFFKKSVKLSGKCRISDNKYDTIIENKQVSLFGSVYLPVFIEKTVYKPYETSRTPALPKIVEEQKKRLIAERISEITSDAELLESTIYEYETADKIIVIGSVKCIADIGVQKEVKIED